MASHRAPEPQWSCWKRAIRPGALERSRRESLPFRLSLWDDRSDLWRWCSHHGHVDAHSGRISLRLGLEHGRMNESSQSLIPSPNIHPSLHPLSCTLSAVFFARGTVKITIPETWSMSLISTGTVGLDETSKREEMIRLSILNVSKTLTGYVSLQCYFKMCSLCFDQAVPETEWLCLGDTIQRFVFTKVESGTEEAFITPYLPLTQVNGFRKYTRQMLLLGNKRLLFKVYWSLHVQSSCHLRVHF